MNTLDWDLFAKPAPLINMAARSFARLGERRLKSLGLNVAQVPVLYLLRNGEALSQKSLAQLTRAMDSRPWRRPWSEWNVKA